MKETEFTNGEDTLEILGRENLGALCEESSRAVASMVGIITVFYLEIFLRGKTEITLLSNLNIFTDLIIKINNL